MKYEMRELPYDREKAVAYAHQWAYYRNPNYYNFQDIGGDCTNFTSQCIYAGSGIMNYTPTRGWYYISVNDRAPAWTGVQYLYNFLTSNIGVGPYGHEVTAKDVQPGDVVQLSLSRAEFQHSPIVVGLLPNQEGENAVIVAAHSADCDYRPLASYAYRDLRFIHIDGVRSLQPTET